MKLSSLPSYSVLEKAINKFELKLNPSQAHGLVCGLLCNMANTKPAWEELIPVSQSSDKIYEMLESLYEVSAKQLKSTLFDFQLILPLDSEDLIVRAEALTLWCQGFLTGLKIIQVDIEGREPSEVTEAINDLIEIAKMNYEEVISSEEDEVAYVELVEFVRIASILIYQDCHEDKTEMKTTGTLNQIH